MSAIPLESVEVNEVTSVEDYWSEPEETIEVSLSEPDISIAQNEADKAEKEIDVILERPEEPQNESKENQPLVLVKPPTLPCLPVKFKKWVVVKERSQIFYTAGTFTSDDHDLTDSYVLEVPDELLILKEGDKAGPALERKITINNEDLVTSLEKRREDELPSISTQHCIFRVPEGLRKLSENAFTPQAVSLGPLHCDKLQQFKAIENLKFHYRTAFLAHQSWMELMNECKQNLKGIEKQARECYAEEIELSSDEFVEMMMLDGCFLIEFFLRDRNGLLREEYDPLFDNPHFDNAFKVDLLLLENQLPFIVLTTLFSIVNNAGVRKLWNFSFLELAMKYYDIESLHLLRKPKHLLDLVLQKYIPPKTYTKQGNGSQDRFTIIPRAVHLWETGVRFEPPQEERHLLDVSFEKGVLKIPVIDIEYHTESLFQNLIAFEQYYKHSTYVEDYTTLMGHLIYTESDVALLRQAKVVTNWLGNDRKVSDMFNKLGKNVVTSKEYFHYVHLYKELNNYCANPWHKWTAMLKRDYFNTPWSLIAFLSASADREIDGVNEQLEEDAKALEHMQLQLLQERSRRSEVERENTMLQNQLIESRGSTYRSALQLANCLDYHFTGMMPVIFEDKDESSEDEEETADDIITTFMCFNNRTIDNGLRKPS
ncbi:hypothetical protein Sjap_019187 [Stephania japonica]|uniref:Uncharacterized protein n=1 Tax=Stephania japonica TaxID=461633 RepID=A0AAP0F5I2_9MAGN